LVDAVSVVDDQTFFVLTEYLRELYGETPIEIMNGIKRVFDEKNILNPQKITN